MLANLAKLALVAVTAALFTTEATAASAQRIQRYCMKMKDPVKCVCVFSNNGHTVNSGGQRRVVIYGMGDLDRYVACMKRHGRA